MHRVAMLLIINPVSSKILHWVHSMYLLLVAEVRGVSQVGAQGALPTVWRAVQLVSMCVLELAVAKFRCVVPKLLATWKFNRRVVPLMVSMVLEQAVRRVVLILLAMWSSSRQF